MTWWIWILIGFLLLGFELASTTLHIGLFAIGAFLVAGLAAFGVAGPLWTQLLVFTVVSLVALVVVRPVLIKRFRLDKTPVVDTFIGEQATAMEDIAPAAIGKAEMRGTTWSAQNVGQTALSRGQRCRVEHVEGLLIHVRA
jgi:inner membrane protein